MTDNIIQLEQYRPASGVPQSPAKVLPRLSASKPAPAPCTTPLRKASTSDGRRRNEAASRSIEPNITELLGKNGKRSYRVQIRKTVNGTSKSFTKTFSQLAMARKWKKRKIAELELQDTGVVESVDATVADAITARLSAHKNLGRSATAAELAQEQLVRSQEAQ